MFVKTKIRFLILAFFLSAVVFTTCDSPMGMGDAIDWIAPVLTMDKVSNPYYVKKNSVLSGTVTDNVAVDRMVFLNASTGKELFPVVRVGSNWTINLNFTSAQNGEKIVGQIIAYDRAGNSGETSIAFVTMIIDINPPIVDYVEIKRTDTRVVRLDSYRALKALEGTDVKKDLYSYQNGWFYLNAIISDKETKVKITELEFYDYNKINTLLLSMPIDPDKGESLGYPQWLVKEEDLIAAGQAVFPVDYTSNYYDRGARYYYRVVIKALDMSNNELQEDEGYMCLWADSDKPKGIADPAIVGTDDIKRLPKGTPIPVEFYDDDSLLWAFTGLLKKDQWNGISGSTPSAKLLTLKKTLTGNLGENPSDVALGTKGSVLDWANKPIIDQIDGKDLDEKIVYVATGQNNTDYGDYILFTITADKKLPPHPSTPDPGAVWTSIGRWEANYIEINLKDENAPLIVFDKKATPDPCPEENTFPQTLVGGENFYIVGYTLRENGIGSTFNRVEKFRMAWIPYHITGGQSSDEVVSKVQEALKDTSKTMPAGVQSWDFFIDTTGSAAAPAGKGLLKLEKYNYQLLNKEGNPANPLDTTRYTMQSFKKKFNVMGGSDDINTSTQNFMYDYKVGDGPNATLGKDGIPDLENETKLFIFYAQDSMGNEIFSQLPILGFKSNPKIIIYDITYKLDAMPEYPSVPKDIPNPTVTGNFTESTGAPTDTYYGLLNDYNKHPNVIAALRGAFAITPVVESIPLQFYPRGTTVKYWVDAGDNRFEGDNRIPIQTLTMKDITFAKNINERKPVGGNFTDKTFSFCEYYPDVTQRTFLFEATDRLGNVASVQRTVAISNAARLENITTTKQSGTYGHGEVITLQANFSSQIYVEKANGTAITSEAEKPRLHVRYKLKDNTTYENFSIPCNDNKNAITPQDPFGLRSASNSLSFDFNVPLNADSILETIFEGIGGSPAPLNNSRPIELPGTGTLTATKIMDANKDKEGNSKSAFIPGYTSDSITMPNWKDTANTLQPKKQIRLDGVHPTISTWALDTYSLTNPNGVKDPYSGTGATAERYFKTGESITLILTSEKEIRASGNSRLEYSIRAANGTTYTYPANSASTGYFKYQKPVSGNPRQLIYSLKVDADSCPVDGELINVKLYQYANPVNTNDPNNSDIIDNANNNIDQSSTANFLSGLGKFYIKKTTPAKPSATLSNIEFSITDQPLETVSRTDYRGTVTLKIPNSTSTYTDTTNTIISWEDRKQYSLDGGIVWQPSSPTGTTTELSVPINTAKTHDLQVRYLDRAGNVGAVAKRTITINNTFPALVSVNSVEGNGWYTSIVEKKNNSLTINLNFADEVTVSTPGQVTIKLKNRNTPIPTTDPYAGTDEVTLTTNMAQGEKSTKITFQWTITAGKEMRDGLYISDVVLTGLSDKFGIQGPTGTGSYTGTPPTGGNFSFAADCPNLAAGLRVDSIAPIFDATQTDKGRTPQHDPLSTTGNALVKKITLTFREPVMKGSGVITIRPRGNYAIPPVLDDTGYYLGYTSNGQNTGGTEGPTQPVPTKFSSAGTKYKADGTTVDATNGTPNRTYISSFYDIYNALTNPTDKNALVKGATAVGSSPNYTQTQDNTNPSLSRLMLNTRTGQSAGPYKKMTQGLISGFGYSGNYSNTPAPSTGGVNSPDANVTTAMIPDTATKWVLDYQYSITGTNTEVTAIRTALNNAKWRWKEIDVYNAKIEGTGALLNRVVTIELDEPLLKGLDWEVYYPEGTFTDSAGNPAPKSGNFTNNVPNGTNNDYYFTSPGVQAPVIRVDRRSYDARNSNWASNTNRSYDPPKNTGGTWNTNAATVSDNGSATDTGWGIQDFNYVHYRVETESSAVKGGASISAYSYKGASGNKGGVTADWSGNVVRTTGTLLNSDATVITTGVAWTDTGATRGTWVLSNLIRRAADSSTSYNVITKNGTPEVRNFQVTGGALRMLKSYNRDLTQGDLDAVASSAALSNGQGVLTFGSLEASKSYIVGSATCNSQTAKGYEGVFRTVIILNYTNNREASNYFQVQGSNIKNGMPSIAGFPVRDAEETGDNRFIKVFCAPGAASDDDTNAVNLKSYYWVSTEIVCEWYFLNWGGGSTTTTAAYKRNGTHQNTGEVNNYLMVGYGDLTYGFNIGNSNMVGLNATP